MGRGSCRGFDHRGCDSYSPVFWDDNPLYATSQRRANERSKILRILNSIQNEKKGPGRSFFPTRKNFFQICVRDFPCDGYDILMEATPGHLFKSFLLGIGDRNFSLAGQVKDGLKRGSRFLRGDENLLELNVG